MNNFRCIKYSVCSDVLTAAIASLLLVFNVVPSAGRDAN